MPLPEQPADRVLLSAQSVLDTGFFTRKINLNLNLYRQISWLERNAVIACLGRVVLIKILITILIKL